MSDTMNENIMTPEFRESAINKKENFLNRLIIDIAPFESQLLRHPIYKSITDMKKLHIFMESHIFAVWDFMSLLKSLQRFITCVDVPWTPPTDGESARLINDIVLGEESDEAPGGVHKSHFTLYLDAMDEVGADTSIMKDFIDLMEDGCDLDEALQATQIPKCVKDFVKFNIDMAMNGKVHEVAAAFLFGREEVIPDMFRNVIESLEGRGDINCESFKYYLERHVHLDEDCHAPMGRKLLKSLCGTKLDKWQEATIAAQKAIDARLKLWDGLILEISNINIH